MPLTTDEKVALLSRLELFRGIPDGSLRAIAERAQEIDFPPGRYIVQQGQTGSGLYLVISGKVKVMRGTDVLAELGPGELIGEISVFDQEPRMASVIAEEPTRCLGIASWDFIELMEQDPKLAINVLRVMSGRLRAATAAQQH
jgi:CRP/FNR family cyclic AMP-dependent transcriptional regulator